MPVWSVLRLVKACTELQRWINWTEISVLKSALHDWTEMPVQLCCTDCTKRTNWAELSCNISVQLNSYSRFARTLLSEWIGISVHSVNFISVHFAECTKRFQISSVHFRHIADVFAVCVLADSLSSSNQLVAPAAVAEEEEELEEDEEQLADLTTIVSEEVIQEADIAPPPQTDILPWVTACDLLTLNECVSEWVSEWVSDKRWGSSITWSLEGDC